MDISEAGALGRDFFGARTFSLEIEPADKGSSWEDDPVHTTSTGHSRWGISSRQHCSSVAAVRVTLFVQSRVTRNGGPSHIMTLMTTHDDCPSLSILTGMTFSSWDLAVSRSNLHSDASLISYFLSHLLGFDNHHARWQSFFHSISRQNNHLDEWAASCEDTIVWPSPVSVLCQLR